jgi:hypothetical protein
MRPRIRQISAVVAAALVIAAVSVLTLTPIGPFLVGRISLLWLGVTAALCGALLAMSSERALLLVTVAAGLAVVIFGGVWSYLVWVLIGQDLSAVVSFWELALSDYVFLYVAQRGAIIFMFSAAFGVVGAVIAPGQARNRLLD